MNKVVIEKGMKCFAATNLSRTNLLCTVESVQGNMLTLKLPCRIKGYTHVQIHIKDVILKQQSDKPKEQKTKPPIVKDNPYRRHLENLLKNPIPKPIEKPAPQVQSYSENGDTPDTHNDLLRITLLSMPINERRQYISALGGDGKQYHDLLQEKK